MSSAHFSSTPDSRADTGLGASEWASGSQVCMGNRPALVPKPMAANTKAIIVSEWSSAGAMGRMDVQNTA
jgi:hypothetical protein